MANYRVTVRSSRPPADAFAYMADLRNFAEWDPGVKKVDQVSGNGGGADASFDVTVKGFVGDLTLTYRTTEYRPPERMVATAKSTLLTSVDTIIVTPDDTGSLVTYDAELTLNGPLKLADPLLGITFKQIGDRAAKGLIEALDGARVDLPEEQG